MIVEAHAKVNLHLKVFPKDKGGYHPIESLFHTVALCDTLEIKNGKSGIKITSSHDIGQNNTLVKAYDAFCKIRKISPPIDVHLEKKIPLGGGLGGGSSDGAALAVALGKMTSSPLNSDEKKIIGGAIGCDSHYFLAECGAALVEGYGEIITPIKARNLFIVILTPKVFSGTKRAYELLDEFFATDERKEKNNKKNAYPLAKDFDLIYNGLISAWRESFFNSFKEPITKEEVIVARALDALKSTNPSYYNMTGSGAAVFAVYDSKDQATLSCSKLVNDGWEAVTAF